MFAHSVGARVVVHPHNVTGFPGDDGISVRTGASTQIGIETVNIYMLNTLISFGNLMAMDVTSASLARSDMGPEHIFYMHFVIA